MKANPVRGALLALGLLLLSSWSAVAQERSTRSGTQGTSTGLPVLLVPGWLGRLEDLSALRDRFVRDGWEEWEVKAVEFADPVGSNRDHARELEEALGQLLADTRANQADVVVHSMGGLALWLLLQQKGESLPVRRVVFLGSPLQGTLTAYLAWGEGGEEMRPGAPAKKP